MTSSSERPPLISSPHFLRLCTCQHHTLSGFRPANTHKQRKDYATTLLSWLPPFRNINPELEKTSPLARSESPPIEAMNPAHLAEKVAELCWELDRARDMCEQANLQFDRYRLEIVGLKRQLGLEKDACRQAHEIVFRESNHNTQLRGQVKTLQTGLRRETVLNSQLQARLNTESASLRAATRHSRTQEEKLIDTQLDLEYLRCTTGEEQPPSTIAISNDAPLPAQPFVVVLIDGDAYQVNLHLSIIFVSKTNHWYSGLLTSLWTTSSWGRDQQTTATTQAQVPRRRPEFAARSRDIFSSRTEISQSRRELLPAPSATLQASRAWRHRSGGTVPGA